MSGDVVSRAPLPAMECGAVAWRLLRKAPGVHVFGGFLLVASSEVLPAFGAVIPIRHSGDILLAVGSLISGLIWVGMSSAALAEFRGGEATVGQLFAPLGDRRLIPSLVFGGIVAVMMLIASLVSSPFLDIDLMHMDLNAANLQRSGLELMVGVFIQLLPLVVMAYCMFPAGFYIAHGEMNCFTALRKGAAAMSGRQ